MYPIVCESVVVELGVVRFDRARYPFATRRTIYSNPSEDGRIPRQYSHVSPLFLPPRNLEGVGSESGNTLK